MPPHNRHSSNLTSRYPTVSRPFPGWKDWLRNYRNGGSFFDENSPILGRIQSLETRLARSRAEIRAAQALRFEVFYNEMSAIADAMTLITRRDKDDYDRICDHLLVMDHDGAATPQVVATYRLLRQEIAESNGGFYTAQEYDLDPLLRKNPDLRFMELGRSCVLPSHRSKRTLELLWQGTCAYVVNHNIDVMIGCASLEGVDPQKLALELSFLHHHARAPKDWRVNAVAGRGVAMNRMAKDSIDARAALRALPPIIKGYLRAGAWIGEEAVVDHQFGTTDVLIVFPVANIHPRYASHFGVDTTSRAA